MRNETNEKPEMPETIGEKKPWVSPSATVEQVSDATRTGAGVPTDGAGCTS